MQNTTNRQTTSPQSTHETNVIFTYSRREAIEDGVLVEIPSELSKEAGVTVHCAMTAGLFSKIAVSQQDKALGQSITGRLWGLLNNFKLGIKLSGAGLTDQLTFSLLIVSAVPGRKRVILIKAIIGAGDHGEACITFMLPDED